MKEIDPKDLKKITEIIKKKAGIEIDENRFNELNMIINNRINKIGLPIDNYLNYISLQHEEIVKIASFFTIQETCFYRNKNHFDALKNHIFRSLIYNRRQENNLSLKILSAGAATGEEPYTIAMILNDLIHDIEKWDIKIIAVDINQEALDKAIHGEYSDYKLRNLDQYYTDKYFEKKTINNFSRYKINNDIKNMIKFRQCNLINEPFELKKEKDIDFILCKNVIIYFSFEAIEQLMNNFYKILSDKGILILGYSETLNNLNHNFKTIWHDNTFFYLKDDKKSEKTHLPIFEENEIKQKQNKTKMELYYIYSKLIFTLLEKYQEQDSLATNQIIDYIQNNNMKKDWRFYLLLAEYYFDIQDYNSAMWNAQACLKENSFCYSAHLLLAAIYLDMNKNDEVKFELNSAFYIDNQVSNIYYYMAKFYEKMSDYIKKEEYMSIAYNKKLKEDIKSHDFIFPLNFDRKKKINDEIEQYRKSIKSIVKNEE